MQLTYRGIHFQSRGVVKQAVSRKPMGMYRGLPLSFQGASAADHGAEQHPNLTYRGVAYRR